jgi:hypothetical protein
LKAQGVFLIGEKLFSPDGDGQNDYATIRYEMPEPGYMGNITVYDAGGRPVRFLMKSALLGLKGVITWDGLNENNNVLPVGVYIIMMEVFNLKGKTNRFKKIITLARKF